MSNQSKCEIIDHESIFAAVGKFPYICGKVYMGKLQDMMHKLSPFYTAYFEFCRLHSIVGSIGYRL